MNLTLGPTAYHSLTDDEKRLLNEWLVEHTGRLDEPDWTVHVRLTGEGQIVVRTLDRPPQWYRDEHGDAVVITHDTTYPSHRPPPVWPIGRTTVSSDQEAG